MIKRMTKLDFIKMKTFYLWTLCDSEETGHRVEGMGNTASPPLSFSSSLPPTNIP